MTRCNCSLDPRAHASSPPLIFCAQLPRVLPMAVRYTRHRRPKSGHRDAQRIPLPPAQPIRGGGGGRGKPSRTCPSSSRVCSLHLLPSRALAVAVRNQRRHAVSVAADTPPSSSASSPSRFSFAPSSVLMASSRGGWEGSEVTEYDLLRLRRARKIPPAAVVRVPGDEVAPEPQPGECVVFTSHFAHGFGLPASTFFRAFLDYYHLQPHHLSANAVMLLSAFVTFCEGYLGVRPSIGLWVRFFHFRAQMVSSG